MNTKLHSVIIDCKNCDAISLSNQLKNNPNIETVKIFQNAYDGLAYITKSEVDVVLFNLETPYAIASGYMDRNINTMPYIITTSAQSERCDTNKKRSKVVGYLIKPIETNVLNKYLEEVLLLKNAFIK